VRHKRRDEIFIMLIFFIVTASFVRETTINVDASDNDSQSVQEIEENEQTTVIILVDEQDEVFFEARRVDVSAVRSLLAQKLASDPNAKVVVRAHNESTTNTYVQIADASRSAGIIDILLIPFGEK